MENKDPYYCYLESSLEELKKHIKEMKSRPILFIGSGFSRRYIDSPSWYGLLKVLIEENPEIELPIEYFVQEHNNDYAKIASQLVNFYRDYAWKVGASDESGFPSSLFTAKEKNVFLKHKISTLLINLMAQFNLTTNEWSNELELIAKLNPQAIVTTNYDSLLESLFPKYTTIVGQQVIYEKKSTNIGHILKIHGSVEHSNSIVIEKQDYDNFFNKQIYLIAKLFTYFMEHPVIFIGYSLNDENIKSILYNVKQIIDANSEPLIPNMWFIDWSKDGIDPMFVPSKEKSISAGHGESVRLNYIYLHTYEKLYEALYQDSVDIEALRQLEDTIYNVVKSDTITNLEVDIASLKYLTDRESFMEHFTNSSLEELGQSSFLSFATINDPNQLALLFSLTATELTKRVFENERSYWSHGYALIEEIRIQTGVNLRDTNNDFHVSMRGVSRYSIKMVDLLKKIKNNEPYNFECENRVISYP